MKEKIENQFLKEYEKFINTNGGKSICSDRRNDWFNAVELAHKDIRKYIGGESLEKELDIQACSLPLDRKNPWLLSTLKRIPAYLSEYNLSIDDILLPNIAKYKNISTTKHMKTHVQKYVSSTYDYYAKENAIYEIDTLATIYGQSKILGGKYSVLLKTDPMSFAKLGHYGHDSTCFANGGQNWHHKYKIALKYNSFVILIALNNSILARCWGFLDIKNDIWHTLNHYAYKISDATMQYVLSKFFDKTPVYGKAASNCGIYINNLKANNVGQTISFVNKPSDTSTLISVKLPKYIKTFKDIA